MSSKTENRRYPSVAHERSAPFVIDPAYSALHLSPSPPATENDRVWLYGEAELECFRLGVLRKRAKDAKLKVYYPGSFHSASHRALFRLKTVDSRLLDKEFSFRCNGHVVVRFGQSALYQSDASTEIHTVSFKSDAVISVEEHDLVIEITTDASKEELVEPPCLWLASDSPFYQTPCSWEWSSNGTEWTFTRSFQSVEGVDYPHQMEAPEMRLAPKKRIKDQNVYDFGVELLGRIIVVCDAGIPAITVGESIAEALNDNPEYNEQSTEMVATDRKGTFKSAHLLAFRYVRVDKCNVTDITCMAQFHPVQYHGAFACSDETLSRIWMNSAYTLRLCMHDFVLDGIKRDRLPWTGDLAVSLLANAYTFADADIIRRSLTVLGRAGIKKSDINGIVDYSLWWIICQDVYQLYFDDKEHLEREWGRIKEVLCCLEERTDTTGFLKVNKETDWVFIDWVDCEKTTALQILWWWALDCGSRLAQRMNDSDTVTKLQKRQADVKDKLVSSCWDDTAGLWLGAPIEQSEASKHSRHANILAIVSGLTSPDESSQIKEALLGKELDNVGTPYMKTFECLALARLGAEQMALSAVSSYWGRMIENGATTFWEAFDEAETKEMIPAFYDRPFGRSLCHAWSAGPCQFLPETLLGIRPTTDGWSEWTCNPKLGEVTRVSATVPTPRGCIEIEASSESVRVVVPADTTLIMNGSSFVGPEVISRPMNTAIDSADIDSATLKKWSAPYRGWHYYPDHVIPPKPPIAGFEDIFMTDVPTVYRLPGDATWYMSFIGFNGKGYQSFVAESDDLVNWSNMRLAMGFGSEGEFDYGGCVIGAFLYNDYGINAPRTLKKKDGKYWSLYGAYAKQGEYEIDPGYEGIASSSDGVTWERANTRPILSVYDSDVRDWERDSIYQPWLVEHEGRYYNFYNAKRMPEWVEQIGLATSTNMFDWMRCPENPVLRVRAGGFDADFVADGKVFKDGDHWTMFYFGVGKGGAHVMIAFSRDLHHWTAESEPLYKAGENPSRLDSQYAHKISLVWNPNNDTWYMFYCAVGDKGRGIGLITSRPL